MGSYKRIVTLLITLLTTAHETSKHEAWSERM